MLPIPGTSNVKMGWMTGFEPATVGATVRPEACDEVTSDQLARMYKELQPQRGEESDEFDLE